MEGVLLLYMWLRFICLSVFLSFCLCVCYTRIGAQTAEPIVSKLCMSIEGHLAGNIGHVSCAWVHGGLRERRRKRGGVIFLRQRVGERERLIIRRLRVQIPVTALKFFLCFFIKFFRFSHLELVYF